MSRYISGKRPGYAPRSSSEEESEDEEFIVPSKLKTEEGQSENEEVRNYLSDTLESSNAPWRNYNEVCFIRETFHLQEPEFDLTEAEKSDPRLRRLQSVQTRHRR